MLVPGLAIDDQGHRIGYGKGFYDQLLPTLPNATSCFVGYDFQLVAEVPAAAHDVAVDLQSKGVLAKDTHATSIRFAPPLVISKEQLDEALDIIIPTLNAY